MDFALNTSLRDADDEAVRASLPMFRYIPAFGRDTSKGGASTFVRAGQVVRADGVTLAANAPAIYGGYNMLEDSTTNQAIWSNSSTEAHGFSFVNSTQSTSTTEYAIVDAAGNPLYANLIGATADNGRITRLNIPMTNGTPIVYSIYVKGIGGANFRVAGHDGVNLVELFFNPTTGAFFDVTDAGSILNAYAAEAVPTRTGWYRLRIAFTPKVTGTSGAASIGLKTSGTQGLTSASQFEIGTTQPTSYVYTEESTAGRSTAESDTSGNGLQFALNAAMIASLSGGSGSLIQWVRLPWAMASDTINILTASNAANSGLYLSSSALTLSDGTNQAVSASLAALTAGDYCFVAKWSPTSMSVGTCSSSAVSWGTAATCDGAFPIEAGNKLRWMYGGGKYPVGIGPLAWYDAALADAAFVWSANEIKP